MPRLLYNIREAVLDDAPAISTIYRQSTQAAYQEVMVEAPIYSQLLDRMEPFWSRKLAIPASKEQRILVAECAGRIAGFVDIGTVHSPGEDSGEEIGELHFLFVAPDFWGGGIGSHLLTQATELFRTDCYRAAILWVFSKNYKARSFYESAGWRTDGVERPDPALAFLTTPPLEVCYRISFG